MSDNAERIAVECPGCSPDAPTAHEVLKPGGHATVRCTECGHTHKVEVPAPGGVERDVVVSQEGESTRTAVEVDPDERIAVGDEFIVDTDAAIVQVEVTALQTGPEQRVEETTADAVETIWTRVVDNVAVDVTIHPTDGNRDRSRSVKMRVPGDYEFTVGERESVGDEAFTVEGIQLRDEATEYRHDKLDHEGDVAFAKDVKRVYARDETTDAWSPW